MTYDQYKLADGSGPRKCDCCEDIIPPEDQVTIRKGGTICKRCELYHYAPCLSCGELTHADEDDEDCVCDRCNEGRCNEDYEPGII